MIDFEPDEEQQLIVDTVRQFAQNEIRPRARECDESGKLPDEVLAAAHELGLVANGLPEEHGGGGERSAVTGALIAEELAWGDLAIALAILSPGLMAYPVADFGTETQRKEWIPRFTGGRFVAGALGLVEPRFGSDPFRPRATARRDGDGWILDGAKCIVPWIDGGEGLLVFADEGGTPQGFLVPRDADGLSARREALMGIQALPTAELTLSGVRVPGDARLGGEAGADLRRIVTRGRVALAAAGVGVARAAFETARDYAKEREVFGVKVAQKQAIAFMLATMAIEIDGARLLAWEAADLLDRGEDALREATVAYRQVQRVALDVADGAVQVLGGHGYIRDYLPEMHLRNARGFAAFEALALV
ncbi:MAG: acyl-CoA dehydrogenase family protein [Myxococcota bacterium]|nr:acyl-CoA dehydrogenase family protein [Myxococcota bacterium]